MNCLDVRRRLATDPGSIDEPLRTHIRGCEECARALADSKRFEHLLKQAAQVPVPDDLVSKVLLKQTFHRPHRRARWPWALAASVLLGLSAVLGVQEYLDRGRSGLDRDVVALVNAAGYALAAKGPVRRSEIEAALRPLGLSLSADLEDVTFASRCYVRGKLAGHLVLRGERSPVTVFLIPSTRIRAEESIESENLAGILLPADRGTIAVVGAPGEPLDGVVDKVRHAVRWRA